MTKGTKIALIVGGIVIVGGITTALIINAKKKKKKQEEEIPESDYNENEGVDKTNNFGKTLGGLAGNISDLFKRRKTRKEMEALAKAHTEKIALKPIGHSGGTGNTALGGERMVMRKGIS